MTDESHIIRVPLTRGQFAIIDAEDGPLVLKHSWHAHVRSDGNGTKFYARAAEPRPSKKNIYMHRLLLGLTERTQLGDHRDRDGLNNRRSNLRVATPAQNSANSKKGVLSHKRGVCFDKSRRLWRVCMSKENRIINLGRFPTEEDAYKVYLAAIRDHFGEFFPEYLNED